MSNEYTKVYKLFITKTSKENEEYNQFLQRLNQVSDFLWEDTALSDEVGYTDLEEQIRSSEVVIVLSGLISSYPKFIQKQIKISRELKKPLVVIRPYGMENVPLNLEKLATQVVGWNGPCIVDAIKTALGEDEEW